MHTSSPSGSESGSQSRMAPETFRLDPIPNADLDTDSDPDAGRSSCAGGEGHPFMTVAYLSIVAPIMEVIDVVLKMLDGVGKLTQSMPDQRPESEHPQDSRSFYDR